MPSPKKIGSKNYNGYNNINEVLSEIEARVKENVSRMESKVNDITNVYLRAFSSPSDQGGAAAVTWAIMDTPISLLLTDLNVPLILHLHFIVEAFIKRDAINVAHIKNKKIRQKLNALHLLDYCDILMEEGVLDSDDRNFLQDLNQFRNAIAHLNLQKLSKFVNSGKVEHILDVEDKLSNVDLTRYVVGVIQLFVKLSKFSNAKQSSKTKTHKVVQ